MERLNLTPGKLLVVLLDGEKHVLEVRGLQILMEDELGNEFVVSPEDVTSDELVFQHHAEYWKAKADSLQATLDDLARPANQEVLSQVCERARESFGVDSAPLSSIPDNAARSSSRGEAAAIQRKVNDSFASARAPEVGPACIRVEGTLGSVYLKTPGYPGIQHLPPGDYILQSKSEGDS